METSPQLEQILGVSLKTTLVYGAVLIYGAYYFAVQHYDYALLSPLEILWNILVYTIPTFVLLDAARRQELRANDMLAQTHAAKSDALRKILGMGGSAIMQSLPMAAEATSIGNALRRASTSVSAGKPSDVPAGLGNWDNSCYQNSVLQALSSLGSLRTWLTTSEARGADNGPTTNIALQEIISKLRDPANNGRHIWTPAKLKSMSSWQQQDAQEYFSKVMDELDKEASKAFGAQEEKPGLEVIVEKYKSDGADMESHDIEETKQEKFPSRNPLEGLVAQRVACTKCGFSEGYSMIPFNCLTVPLGPKPEYELSECLDEYTRSEDIEGVECRSCTLLQNRAKLRQLQLPPELRGQIEQRLRAIEQALESDDFSDKTLKQECLISPKAYVSSTKSKEVIIGRAPKSLVVHVNRSVFDPMTGSQRKNYAQVRYPLFLDLRHWMLGIGDMPATYKLSAVVTHYGRHENGHYICYRRHPRLGTLDNIPEAAPTLTKEYPGEKESWWRLSDEDVSAVSEQDVLQQGGVFMLFYECMEEQWHHSPPLLSADVSEAARIPLPPDESTDWDMLGIEASSSIATPSLVSTSPSTAQSVVYVSESDTDYEGEDPQALSKVEETGPKPAAPNVIRTTTTPRPPSYILPGKKDMKHDFGMSNRSMMSV